MHKGKNTKDVPKRKMGNMHKSKTPAPVMGGNNFGGLGMPGMGGPPPPGMPSQMGC